MAEPLDLCLWGRRGTAPKQAGRGAHWRTKPPHTHKTETNTRDRRHASGGWAQAKVQGLSQGRLTSRGLGPLGGTSEVQSKRGNATVFESSKANAVGTPLAKPTQREELRWKNKQRTYGKPSTKTSLGGDGSTCLGGCQPATPTYVGSPPDDEQVQRSADVRVRVSPACVTRFHNAPAQHSCAGSERGPGANGVWHASWTTCHARPRPL